MTNTAILEAIQSIDVTGVSTHYDYPPLSLGTSDLPAAFPLLPTARRGEPLSSCMELSKTRAIIFVVCVEPVGQEIQSVNYNKLATLMDNLETELDALKVANYVGYDITTTTEFAVAGIKYWTIVVGIELSIEEDVFTERFWEVF